MTAQTPQTQARPEAETRPGGRWLFAALAVGAGVLLLFIGSLTQPGFGDTGWWNEPRNGPFVSLSLLFVFAALASVFAGPDRHDRLDRQSYVALLLSAVFLGAVWLIGIVGYAFSVLFLTGFAGALAGFRGRRLALVSLGLTVAMVLLFREALGLWFPRAWLFQQAPWLSALGRHL